MNMKKIYIFTLCLFAVLVSYLAYASSNPTISILDPAEGKTVWSNGQSTYPIRIIFSANDTDGVDTSSFKLSVDGGPFSSITAGRWGLADTYWYDWAPTPGSHTIQIQAADSTSVTGNSRKVNVNVRVVQINNYSTFPGDGKLLIRDNDNTICMSCHAIKSHTSAVGGTKYGNWERVCRDCHTPHNTRNIFLLQSSFRIYTGVNQSYMGNRRVDFRNISGPSNFGFASKTGYTKRGPCEVCHTRTNHFRYNGDGPDQTHTNVGGESGLANTTCTAACHKHTGGFFHGVGMAGGTVESCLPCHGHTPGYKFTYNMVNYSSQGKGNYVTHATHTELDSSHQRGPNVFCDTCHDVNKMPTFKTGTDSNGDGSITLSETNVCDSCHSPGGTYNGVNSANGSIGAKDNFKSSMGQYANGGVYNADGTLKTGKDKWCAGCHDESPSVIPAFGNITAPPVIGNESGAFNYGTGWGFYKTGHGVPTNQTMPASGGAKDGPGKKCPDCHDTAKTHIDGNKRTFACAPGSGGGACSTSYQDGYRLKNISGIAPMQMPPTGLNRASYMLCFSCHTNTDSWLTNNRGTTNYYDESSSVNRHYYHLNASQNSELDWDGAFNTGMSCITCHNVHGSRNPSMIRSGELTGYPSLTVRYGDASSTHTAGQEEPNPNNITLANSTKITMRGSLASPYCSHCHGGGTGIASVPRTPIGVAARVPVLSWSGNPGYEADGANPDSAPTGSTFNFRVKYSDVNSDGPPAVIQLWIDLDNNGNYNGAGEKINMQAVTTSPDYYNGVDYTASVAVSKLSQAGSTIKYKFYATYGSDTATGSPTNESAINVLNAAPTLTWTGETNYSSDGVNPDYGPKDGTYAFRVKYTDSDGDSCPASGSSSIQLWVDLDASGIYDPGEKFNMTEVNAADTDCTTAGGGKLYYLDKVLPNTSGTAKTYSYRFYAADGVGTATGTAASGGTVLVGGTANNLPYFAWNTGTCRPQGAMPPKSTTSSTVRFSVTYFDGDNQCPTSGSSSIQAWVDLDNSGTYSAGEKLNMTEDSAGDVDCTPAGGGKNYSVTVVPTTVANGIAYKFYASDGTDSAVGDPATGSTIDVVAANYVVKQDGTEDYTTIGAAITAVGATNNKTILVYNGTYNESLTITQDPLTLVSACGAAETIISNTNNPVVNFNFSVGGILDGFTVTGGSGVGIKSTGNNFNGLDSQPTIKNSIVTGNSGRGVLGYRSTVTITNSEIYNNLGGGVSYYGGSITNTTIRNNSVTGNGGGITTDASEKGGFTLTNVIIKDNTATGSGGGIYCQNSSSSYAPAYEKVTLSGNTSSTGSGGGGYFTYCSPTFTNSLVSDNSAPGGGGIALGIWASAWFVNSTVVNNTATTGNGGGYASSDGAINLANSIVWGNRATVGTGHIGSFTATGVKTVYLYDSIVENNGDDNITDDGYFSTSATVTVMDTGSNHDTDPNFVDSANKNYHIQSPSAAINGAANNSGKGIPADDLEGNSRPSGSQDIGAYEYSAPASDNLPVLAWTGQTNYVSDGVNPDSGAGGAGYEFRVDYSHADDIAPNPIEVWIDQDGNGAYGTTEKYAMTKLGGGGAYDDNYYVNGERYTRTTPVYKDGGGYVNYRFYASDGKDAATDSPTVTKQLYVYNVAPTLAWAGDTNYVSDGVHPNSGASGSSFTFRILYTDSDNLSAAALPAAQVWVDLNDDGSYDESEKYNMTPEAGSGAYHDGSYSNGEILVSSPVTINYSGDGTLMYRFYFTDVLDEATGTPTDASYLTITRNQTTIGTATATASVGSDTIINVSMSYTHDDNGNNTYETRYCISSNCAATWTSAQSHSHSASPVAASITGLTPGETYNVEMKYLDADGIEGTNPVVQSNVTVKKFATTAGTATAVKASSTTISVSMPYTYDDNANNTYKVEYCSPSPCGGSWIVFGSNPQSHAASPFQTTITGLTTGQSYDVRMTYNDVNGVSGTAVQTVTGILLSSNAAPVGGYTADNVIPAAQITQSSTGDGVITIVWKGTDGETNNVTLNTFQYSVDGGSTWNAPTNGDSSTALSSGWTNNGGSGYTTATTFAGAAAHSFTFNTKHADISGINGVDQSDVRIRFTLNDGNYNSSSPATSDSFSVDDLSPTASFCSAAYDASTNTMTISGANFTTIAPAATDVKNYVDWSKFVWDINGDNATTANISIALGDVTSFTVTNDSKLTLVFTAAKGAAIEATTGYGSTGGLDKMDVTAGFVKDAFGNVATTDAVSDGTLSTGAKVFFVTKTADTKDGACDADCSLREAIDAVRARTGGDVISVPSGTYQIAGTATNEDFNASGDLDVNQSVEIQGTCSSTIVEATTTNTERRVLHVTAGAITLVNMTLQNGSTAGNGGALYAAGGFTIINSKFINNRGANGGAIYNTGAAGNFYGANELTSNTATGSGGNAGGAIFSNTQIVNINGTGSVFTGNNGTGSGGAVYVSANFNVYGATTFNNNGSSTITSGGAIISKGGTINDSTFTNNRSANYGGAIYFVTTAGTVNRSTFSGNYLTTASSGVGGAFYSNVTGNNLNNCTFYNNSAGPTGDGTGGAIYQSAGGANINYCTFYDNKATTAPAIRFAASTSMKNSIVANPSGSLTMCSNVADGGANIQYNGACVGTTPTTLGLSSLADNGGPTQTMALQANSEAIDAGIAGTCLSTDQRGITRPVDGNGTGGAQCDIGAFEYVP